MWIYKITNIENGKVYIGQTVKPIKDRFARHLNDAVSNRLNTHLARAIRKYGTDKFIYEEIDSANSQDELNLKEQYWIRYFNSVEDGYNETDAISKCGGNTYKSKTPDEMEEIKEKIRQTKLGDKNPRHERIFAINILTGEKTIYGSMCECARKLGFPHHQGISRRCRGLIKTPYKKQWLFEYCDK